MADCSSHIVVIRRDNNNTSNTKRVRQSDKPPAKRRHFVVGGGLMLTVNLYDVRALVPNIELALCAVPAEGAHLRRNEYVQRALAMVAELDVSSMTQSAWSTLMATTLNCVGLANCSLWTHLHSLYTTHARLNPIEEADRRRELLLTAAYNVAISAKSTAARDAAHWALERTLAGRLPSMPDVPSPLYTRCAKLCASFEVAVPVSGTASEATTALRQDARTALYAWCAALTERHQANVALAAVHIAALTAQRGAHVTRNGRMLQWAQSTLMRESMPALSALLCDQRNVLWLHVMALVACAVHVQMRFTDADDPLHCKLALRMLDSLVALYVSLHSGTRGGSSHKLLARALYLSLSMNAAHVALADRTFWRRAFEPSPLRHYTHALPVVYALGGGGDDASGAPSPAARVFYICPTLRSEELCNSGPLETALQCAGLASEWSSAERLKSHGALRDVPVELVFAIDYGTKNCSGGPVWRVDGQQYRAATAPPLDVDAALERIVVSHSLTADAKPLISSDVSSTDHADEQQQQQQ